MGDQVQTVPVFAPDGTLGDIPAEKLHDAVAAGFKPGVTMKSPDGKLGVIPSDRYTEAAKSGLTVVPFQQQETQHPGFWKSLGSDLYGMAKGAAGTAVGLTPGADLIPKDIRDKAGITTPLDAVKHAVSAVRTIPQDDARRKAAGYSDLYTAVAPLGSVVGANVSGMEKSATEGDVAGVAGHAAAPLAVMATGEGVRAAAPVISDVASAAADRAAFAARKTAAVVRDVTPKQAAVAAGGVGGAVAGHGPWSLVTGGGAGYTLGRVAEMVLGKDRANAPIFARAPELSLDEIRDSLADTIAQDRQRFTEQQAVALGKLPATGAKPAAQTGEALATQPSPSQPQPPKGGAAPRFTQADRAAAQSLLKDALVHNSADIIDSTIPKEQGAGINAFTKAKVNVALKNGDVAAAEKALDAGAKEANPAFDPQQAFVQRQGKVPSVMEIRQKLASTPGSPGDIQETRSIQEQMRADLEKHGWSAEQEARREFIARNSTGWTKTFGTQAQRDAAHNAAMAGDTGDLIDVLQKSLDEARKKKQGK